MTDNTDILDPVDVAELLGKSESWVLAQCRAGTMPHFKVGKSYRLTRAHLDAFIAGSSVSP